MHRLSRCCRAVACALALSLQSGRAEDFRVATYNLESYLDVPTETRAVKSPESRRKVRESICLMRPDVLAIQEIGGTNALLELRDSLKADGLDLPHWEYVAGYDTNVHVAVLSRFPLSARRPHTNDSFLLGGRRFHVSRGFAEVDVQVNSSYSFTLFAAHLKSKRAVSSGDEAEMRLEEAKLLRAKIDARLALNPSANIVVVGDFNDTKDSASTKAVMGRYRSRLIDTCPAERNGDSGSAASAKKEPRRIAWTHYYDKDDSYARIDYLLLSAGMAREWKTNETYVLAVPDWGQASDHRPLCAAFEARDR